MAETALTLDMIVNATHKRNGYSYCTKMGPFNIRGCERELKPGDNVYKCTVAGC